MENSEERQKLINLVLSAQGLLLCWDADEPVEEKLNNPAMEAVIIEAAAQLGDPDTINEWIDVVRGDGGDERRIRLADKCRQRVLERDNSLSKP